MSFPVSPLVAFETLLTQNDRLQEQFNQILNEKAAWALEKEQLTNENNKLKSDNSKMATEKQETTRKIIMLEDQLKESKATILSVGKTNAALVKQVSVKTSTIKNQEDVITFLEKAMAASRKENTFIRKEFDQLDKERDATKSSMEDTANESTLAELHDKLDKLENEFCRNREEVTTANYKSLLKKVSVGRSQNWRYAISNIQSKYDATERKRNRVLKELEFNPDETSQTSNLVELINIEKQQKEDFLGLYNEELNKIDKLGEELFNSQKKVAKLTNQNMFLRESNRVFGKRKRNDDDANDENARPHKK